MQTCHLSCSIMPEILKSIRESLTVHKITSQHEVQLAGHFNICSQVVSLRLQEKFIKSGQFMCK